MEDGRQGVTSVEGSSEDGVGSVMVGRIEEGSIGVLFVSFSVESATVLVVEDGTQLGAGVEVSAEGGLRSVTFEHSTFAEAWMV